MPLFTPDVNVDNTVLVDGSAVTQPVSGTVTANAGTGTFTVDGSGHTQPVSGTVTANAGTGTFTVDGSGHTQPVSGTVTANAGTGTFLVDGSAHTQPISGSVTTTPVVSNTATITQSTVTTSNSTILASNASRKKAIIFVASSTVLIKFGATASTASFTYKITGNNTTVEITTWTGQLDAITTAGTSLVTVTELV